MIFAHPRVQYTSTRGAPRWSVYHMYRYIRYRLLVVYNDTVFGTVSLLLLLVI